MATVAVLHTQPFTSPAGLPLGEGPTYRVTVGDVSLTLNPGAVPPALAEWLRETGARDFAVLTAANPHSLALSPEANRQRHRSLVRTLVFEDVRFAEAVAVGRDGEQPAVLAFDLGAARAEAFGRAFAQGRVLIGDRRQARLVACEALEFHI